MTKRLDYWKAEDFQKFTYPASEYVLGGLLPDADYHAWITFVRVSEMIFNAGRNGCKPTDLDLLQNLILRQCFN